MCTRCGPPHCRTILFRLSFFYIKNKKKNGKKRNAFLKERKKKKKGAPLVVRSTSPSAARPCASRSAPLGRCTEKRGLREKRTETPRMGARLCAPLPFLFWYAPFVRVFERKEKSIRPMCGRLRYFSFLSTVHLFSVLFRYTPKSPSQAWSPGFW